jgi:hypothetical protein
MRHQNQEYAAALQVARLEEQKLIAAVADRIHSYEVSDGKAEELARVVSRYVKRHLFRGKEDTDRATQDGEGGAI